VERDLASAGVVERAIAAFGPEPEGAEKSEHREAVEQDFKRELGWSELGEHGAKFAHDWRDAKGKGEALRPEKEKRAGSGERGALKGINSERA
jgi:hypothetical protein